MLTRVYRYHHISVEHPYVMGFAWYLRTHRRNVKPDILNRKKYRAFNSIVPAEVIIHAELRSKHEEYIKRQVAFYHKPLHKIFPSI